MTEQPSSGAEPDPDDIDDEAPEPGDVVEVEVLTDDARREQIPSGEERAAKIEQAKGIAEATARKDAAAAASSDTSDETDATSLPVGRRRIRRWWHRHLDSADRQQIMTDLAIKRDRQWSRRFATMQALSVVVSVMGLSADSAAVVIGAMLLAPLMTPVLGTAACVSMALFRRSIRMLGIVLAATAGSIALAYLLAAFVVTSDLPREVTSRTAPDIRDLFVALGAGTAGAYATVRRDVSSSLPGVAVAVALVPPLSVVGIALESGEPTFARGALLLYTTNLVAIVFAGIVVFAATGFVPPRRLELTFRRSATVAVLIGTIVLLIAIPLVRVSRTAVDRSERQIAAQQIVDDWVGQNGYDARRRPEIEFSDGRILVRIRSFDNAPDARTLIDDLHDRFGFGTPVDVEWEKVERAEAITTVVRVPSAEEVRVDAIDQAVRRLLEVERDPNARVDAVSVAGNFVRIDAVGVGAAPSSLEIATVLADELGEGLEVQLTWIERSIADDEEPPTPDDVLTVRVSEAANRFADEAGVRVLLVRVVDGNAVVELVGSSAPDATELVSELRELVGPDRDARVLFLEQRDITSTTTSTTTTTTSTTTTTTTTTTPVTTTP